MKKIAEDFRKILFIFSSQATNSLLLLFFAMLLGAVMEALSIGIIPLFIKALTNPGELSQIRWIGGLFDSFPNEASLGFAVIISIVFMSFMIFKNISLVAVFYYQLSVTAKLNLNLSTKVFKVYQEAPYEWHLKRSSSKLIRNVDGDIGQFIGGVVTPYLDLIMSLIMSTLIIAVMLANMPIPALISLLLTAGGVFLVTTLFRKKLKRYGKIAWKQQENIFKSIQQGFGALIDAKVIGCEQYLANKFRTSNQLRLRANRNRQILQRTTPFAIETFAMFGLITVFVFLVFTNGSSTNIAPLIVLLGVATIRLKQLLSRIANSINSINGSRVYIDSIHKDLRELEQIALISKRVEKPSNKVWQFNRLSLNNVCYSYPEANISAVSDVSLEINRGESVAFVGTTGCGKTTIANILLGLLPVQSGEVLVNSEIPITNVKDWCSEIAYIPQSIYLLDDTIKANIAFGTDKENFDEIRFSRALEASDLKAFVNTLPNGINTVIGERGMLLSGGQKQRIGIARALYSEASVLLMDEATSALDNKTEHNIMESIRKINPDKTLIIIAHRINTVMDCDRLYYMQEGKVSNSGTYVELLGSSNGFRHVVNAR